MNDQNYSIQPEPEKKSNGLGIASFVCGLIAILGCCNPFYLVSLAALILGIVGVCMKDAPKGMAITGIILGVLAVIIWLPIEILLGGVLMFI